MLKVFTAALAAKGAHLLECPITGGLEALKKGQMAVWVGGDKGGVTQCCAVLSQLSRTSQEAYTKVKAVLDASYSSVMYTGGLGTAMIPKVMVVMVVLMMMMMMVGANGPHPGALQHAVRPPGLRHGRGNAHW